ncbi:MAG: hypothetical protein ACRCU2_23815, partial [Planktothrix sp.]
MENLDWLEWNPITTPLTFTVIQHGDFPKYINIIKLSRNSDLQLIAIGEGKGSFLPEKQTSLRQGELVPYGEETIGKTTSGDLIRLKGIYPIEMKEKFLTENTRFLSVSAYVYEAEIFSPIPATAQIEWIINFSLDPYLFSKNTRIKCECVIKEEKYSFIIGCIAENVSSKKYKPGFIEFEGLNGNTLPSEHTKEAILVALSFALGRQIVSIGTTWLSKDRDRIR